MVITAAIELLRQLGNGAADTKELDIDIDRCIAEDDAELMGPLENAVMSVSETFVPRRKKGGGGEGASRLASLDHRASVGRGERTRVRGAADIDPPQLLLTVGEGRTIDAVDRLDATGPT